MQIQRLVRSLPTPLRRHKVIRALTAVFPASRIQAIRYNDDSQAFVDFSDGDARTIAINADFDREYFSIARAFLRDGGVYFDVGANFGLCSFGLLPSCPRIDMHLFEANPNLWAILKRSAALHGSAHLHVVEGAVGEESGETFLHRDSGDDTTGHAYIRPGAGVRTRLLTLDEYIESARIDRVAFTKMDVEGYELFALHGARRSIAAGKLPVVYFELKGPLVQRFGKTVQDVLAFFRASGYRMFHVRQQDFSALKLAPDREIAGLAAREVGDYPDDLWTDLLAIHASAEHIGIRARGGA